MSFELGKHVVPPGGGETIDDDEGSVTILVDPVNSGATALSVLVLTLDPGAEVPVHYHEKAEQILFFLSGRGSVSVGGRETDAPPGTTVHVPTRIAHGIANPVDAPLVFLETTSPPGFEETFRHVSRLSQRSPEDMARIGADHDILVHAAGAGATDFDPARHVLAPGEGEVIAMGGATAGRITILVDPTNTGETALCALIQTLDPGAAVPVHRHAKAEQVLRFLSGRATVSISGHDVEAKPGTTVHVPKGVEHGIANAGDDPLSFFEATTPPGFQEAFRAMSRLPEPTPEAVAAIAGEHDILITRDQPPGS